MSAKKKVKTKTELKKITAARNRERREKYHTDSAYRQKKLEEAMVSYRKQNGFTKKDCRKNIKNISKIGKLRYVHTRTAAKEILCFTMSELAELINNKPLTVFRMHADGRLPLPKTRLYYKVQASRTDKVYTAEEAEIIATIIGEHQSKYSHYRTSHTETMVKLKSAINAYRKGK